MKKLGLSDDGTLDAAVSDVVAQIGSSVKNKYRAVVYYLLVKKLGQEKVYA